MCGEGQEGVRAGSKITQQCCPFKNWKGQVLSVKVVCARKIEETVNGHECETQ